MSPARESGTFGRAQPEYAAVGIATFPVGENKAPLTKGHKYTGLPGSAELARKPKFAAAPGLGFWAGSRPKITILDIDDPNERLVADTQARYGDTPLIARTGGGKFHLYYRHNGEERHTRPDFFDDRPIDLLGSGVVIAPPSRINGGYEFISGVLADVARLPIIQGLPPEAYLKANTRRTNWQDAEHQAAHEGERNSTLFQYLLRQAPDCDTIDDMLDVGRTWNDELPVPLPDAEVVKTVKSAWGYEERGHNWVGRGNRRGIVLTNAEVDGLLIEDPRAFQLLAYLRRHNGPDAEFMVANGLAKKFHWKQETLAKTRARLIAKGCFHEVRPITINTPAYHRWGPKRRARSG